MICKKEKYHPNTPKLIADGTRHEAVQKRPSAMLLTFQGSQSSYSQVLNVDGCWWIVSKLFHADPQS
jgi:hypothetical protein